MVSLKTKLHFRGRVNNNALKHSCTYFCQLYMSTLSCLMRCPIVMLHHPWNPRNPTATLRSHLCGCMQWNVCMLGDTSTNQIHIVVHPFSNIRQHKLFLYLAVIFVILLTCADDFLPLLFCHSGLFLYDNQLQQLPAAVFSGLTSLRSHV
jgi:hypothetical protein